MKSQKAFSLPELLISVGIVGGLLSIVLPSLSQTRKLARQTVCAENLRQWGIGLNSLLKDSKNMNYPFFCGDYQRFDAQISAYIDTVESLKRCPSDTKDSGPYAQGGRSYACVIVDPTLSQPIFDYGTKPQGGQRMMWDLQPFHDGIRNALYHDGDIKQIR